MSTKSKIKPLGDRVIIKIKKESEVTDAGIILPESARDAGATSNVGEVIAVGPGKKNEKGEMISVDVKAGDLVVFSWGEKIEIHNEAYYIVGSDNVLGVITK